MRSATINARCGGVIVLCGVLVGAVVSCVRPVERPGTPGHINLAVERWIETPGGIGGICLSADESRLYAAYWGTGSSAPVEEYEAASGRLLRTFPFAPPFCHGDVVISADARYLVTTNYYYMYASRIDLDKDGEQSQCDLGGERSSVWAGDLDITPDRKLVAVAVGRDGRNYDMKNDQISILNISDGAFELVGELPLPDEPRGHKIAFTRDSRLAYVVTYPRKSDAPRLYEINMTKPFTVNRTLGFPGGDLHGVAVCDALGKVFVSDAAGKRIWAVDLEDFKATSSILLEGAAPGTLAVSHDGATLYALSSATRTMWAIDTATLRVITHIEGLRRGAQDVEISADDSRLFVSHISDNGICVVLTRGVALPKRRAERGAIVFASDREGNYQVFRMDSDGESVVRLTRNYATEMAPRWSPDGKRIAFVSDREGPFKVFIMKADGSKARAIPNTDPAPSGGGVPIDWSPDGKRIVFTSADHTAIRVVNVDGSGLKTLVEGRISHGYGHYHGVCWGRPDMILFNVQNPAWGYDQDIFAVNPDTGEIRQITDEWKKPAHCAAPDLSPDGSKIAVIRQTGEQPPPRTIFVMTADGKDLTNLTQSNRTDDTPRWSPDGKRIVFSSGAGNRRHIWIMNADGTGQTQLTDGDCDDVHPDIK